MLFFPYGSHLRLMCHPHTCTCTNEWCTLCPLCLPRKKAYEASQSYAQKEAQNDHPREFPTYWWLFQMQHFSCSGTRLAGEERRKKMNNSEFQPFLVGHLRIISTHYYCCCRLGWSIISCSKCLWLLVFAAQQN